VSSGGGKCALGSLAVLANDAAAIGVTDNLGRNTK